MSAEMLEVPLLGVGTVLYLERDAWPMAKFSRKTTNEYPPCPVPVPPPAPVAAEPDNL